MSYIKGLDGSQFQGLNAAAPDFNQVKAAGYEYWIQRMTYSYPGLGNKVDPSGARNYFAAKAAGLIPGNYHKVGWTDPISEADFFIDHSSPFNDGDLVAYDIEPSSDVAVPANWSEWEQKFVQRIHDRIGVWPFRYMNISMNNAMPAQGVVKNCGPWVAAPSYGFGADIPGLNLQFYVMQQGPTVHVPGITANVCDTDVFFGTKEQLLKYAYHNPTPTQPPAPTPAPTPSPAPAPKPTPAPEPAPTPEPTPEPSPQPTPAPQPKPVPVVDKPKHWYDFILALLRALHLIK